MGRGAVAPTTRVGSGRSRSVVPTTRARGWRPTATSPVTGDGDRRARPPGCSVKAGSAAQLDRRRGHGAHAGGGRRAPGHLGAGLARPSNAPRSQREALIDVLDRRRLRTGRRPGDPDPGAPRSGSLVSPRVREMLAELSYMWTRPYVLEFGMDAGGAGAPAHPVGRGLSPHRRGQPGAGQRLTRRMTAWTPAVISRTRMDNTVAIQDGTAMVAKNVCTGCWKRSWSAWAPPWVRTVTSSPR